MKKYFLLILIHFLFLGACGTGKTEEDEPATTDDFFEDAGASNNDEGDDEGLVKGSEGNEGNEGDDEGLVKGNEGDEAIPAPLSPDPQSELSLQSCLTDLVSAYWICKKEETIYGYFVNQSPSVLDDEGTDQERARICEFHEGTGPESAKVRPVVAYAHYEKGYCVNRLNQEITARREEGFECSKNEEIFDTEKEKAPCS